MVTVAADDTVSDCQAIAAEFRERGFPAVRQEHVATWPPEWRDEARQFFDVCAIFNERGSKDPPPPTWLAKFYSQEDISVATKTKHKPGCTFEQTLKSAARTMTPTAVKDLDEDDAATRRHGDTARNGKASEKTKRHSAALPEAQVQVIDLGKIFESADNPRDAFPEDYIKGLAESLKKNGQLVDIEVRSPVNGSYELIDGACRYRAAKVAKFVALRCRVIDITDEEAIARRGEFDRRENFSAIAKARWYQQMIDKCGLTQATLAQRLGCDASHVSNMLRLLELPKDWQEKISKGDLPATHGRALCSLNKQPEAIRAQCFAAVEKQIKDHAKWHHKDEMPSVRDIDHYVKRAPEVASRSCTKGHYDGRKFSDAVLEANREELLLVDVKPLHGKKEKRAFNVKLYDKLQSQAKAEQTKAAAKKTKARSSTSSKTKGPAKQRETDPDDYKVEAWAEKWLLRQLAERLPTQPAKVQQAMQMWIVCQTFFGSLLEEACKIRGVKVPKTKYYSDWAVPLWCEMQEWKPRHFVDFTAALLPMLDDTTIQELAVIAKDFEGFDLVKDFRPDREFLELYSSKTLATWQSPALGEDQLEGQEKSVLVEHFLEYWQPGFVPEGPLRKAFGVDEKKGAAAKAGSKRKKAARKQVS